MKNKNTNQVWASAEQLANDPALEKMNKEEFVELPMASDEVMEANSSRRDFLKWAGFSLGAATIAASCDIPVKKAIPYVIKPDEIVPGVANYYASSYVQGGDYCAVLVKTREGRPIKIEGNTLSNVTKGGTSARAQASVLSLYDTDRLPGAGIIESGYYTDKISWEDFDKKVGAKLNSGSTIRIVTNTILSPTTKRVLAAFQQKYPNTTIATYDPVSSSALLQANKSMIGEAVIPDYHFDKADVIVSFGADFLGTWISPVEYAAKYAKNRMIKDTNRPSMSRHVQVESYMSLTGSNADERILIKPSEMGAAISALAAALGISGGSVNGLNTKASDAIKRLAAELQSASGRSLVVSGSNNVAEQQLVNAINNRLGNYGKTLDFAHASMQRQGMDSSIRTLTREMNGGQVDVLLVMDGANPVWDTPEGEKFAAGMSKVSTKVYFGQTLNETGALCNYAAPTHHYLESWGDAEPKRGMLSLIQPTINPLFDTRQTEETLLRWMGNDMSYMDYLKQNWQENMFPQQSKFSRFGMFWDSSLHDGVIEIPQQGLDYNAGNFAVSGQVSKPTGNQLEVTFFETVNVGDGRNLNNPWLTEMPDPVARTTWGNYLAIPISYDGGNSIDSFNNLNPDEMYGYADIVNIDSNGQTREVECVRQFGQPQNTFALALGYGRDVVGTAGQDTGINVWPMMKYDADGNVQYYNGIAVSEKIGTNRRFATVQYHHTMGVKAADETGEVINVGERTSMTVGEGYQGGIVDRTIIFQAKLSEIGELTKNIKEARDIANHRNNETLYPYEEYSEKFYSQGHHWGMWVDLNGCIGCGACQVACIAENNVPVVGKAEVARHHEMTWLRIDRYFYGDFENPNTVYQPMMCQHCDNAPCENVCPVAATNHSSEGLNQMTYNRCIGTRYCANNCPYKVRRFNWLDYTTADLFPVNAVYLNEEDMPYGADNLTRMVLNPDVTVRSRGVIEKCSFCVQRIQEGKLTAKREARALRDGEIKTACQTACPTGAIVFGDLNNKEGALAQNIDGDLNYRVLEEINTQSSVYYSAKVVNKA